MAKEKVKKKDKPAEKVVPTSNSKASSIAIEVDGDNAYLVRVSNEVVTQSLTFEGDGTKTGLEMAVASIKEKSADVRIAINERMSLSISSVDKGQIDFGNPQVVAAIIKDLASKELGNSVTTSARSNYTLPKAEGYSFTFMGMAKPSFNAVVDQVGPKPYPLLPVIGVTALNGVHIHLGFNVSSMYYIEDAIPKYYAIIPQGELKFLYEHKEDGEKLLASGEDVSSALRQAYSSYLAHITERIANQILSWQAEADIDTSTMWLHGVGASLAGIDRVISNRISANIVVPKVEGLEQDRVAPRFYIPYRLAIDSLSDPIRVMTNEKWEATKLLQDRSNARSRTILKVVAALFVVILAFSSYVYLAMRDRNNAAVKLSQDQAQELSLTSYISLYEHVNTKIGTYNSTVSQIPNWNTVWAFLDKTTPQGVQISSVVLSQKNSQFITVDFTASIFQGSPFFAVADWINALKQNGGVNVSVGQLTYSKIDQAETATFTFDVPVRSQYSRG